MVYLCIYMYTKNISHVLSHHRLHTTCQNRCLPLNSINRNAYPDGWSKSQSHRVIEQTFPWKDWKDWRNKGILCPFCGMFFPSSSVLKYGKYPLRFALSRNPVAIHFCRAPSHLYGSTEMVLTCDTQKS